VGDDVGAVLLKPSTNSARRGAVSESSGTARLGSPSDSSDRWDHKSPLLKDRDVRNVSATSKESSELLASERKNQSAGSRPSAFVGHRMLRIRRWQTADAR